jgi:hypothetical protein
LIINNLYKHKTSSTVGKLKRGFLNIGQIHPHPQPFSEGEGSNSQFPFFTVRKTCRINYTNIKKLMLATSFYGVQNKLLKSTPVRNYNRGLLRH